MWANMRKGATLCKPRFLICHHFKLVWALDFTLGLFTIRVLYFTYPILEAKASFLSRVGSHQRGSQNSIFHMLTPPIQDMSGLVVCILSIVGWLKSIHTRFKVHSFIQGRTQDLMQGFLCNCAQSTCEKFNDHAHIFGHTLWLTIAVLAKKYKEKYLRRVLGEILVPTDGI